VLTQVAPEVPAIVVSGAIGDEQAVDMMKAGAGDYLLKDNLTRLVPAVRRGLEAAAVRRERQAALAGLQESERRYRRLFERLQETFAGTVECLASLTELRDPYTAGHQRRVAELAEAVGVELGFDADRLDGLRVAAAVHDIGKMHVPAEILANPGRLSGFEMAIIRTHPEAGHAILGAVDFPWSVAEIVLQHHERIDGSGYPAGLPGDRILPEAAVISVADVVEAMSSHRPYRAACGTEQALAHVAEESGRSLAPDIVAACVEVWEKGFAFSTGDQTGVPVPPPG
jgi:putative nucleotidyltransferase with HDIG domain